jgi:hypothetical protein
VRASKVDEFGVFVKRLLEKARQMAVVYHTSVRKHFEKHGNGKCSKFSFNCCSYYALENLFFSGWDED